MEYRSGHVQIEDSRPLPYPDDDDGASTVAYCDEEADRSMRLRKPSESKVTEDREPFMGMKVRKASLRGDYKGDYLDVLYHPFLVKVLPKQGDERVLFADKLPLGK